MKIKKPAIAALTAVILIGTIGASALYWALGSGNSIASLGGRSNEEIWGAVSCRARIYMQSAQGGVPELSWAEIWGLTLPGRGFDCTSGSLAGGLNYSSIASEDDRKAGAGIFRQRCSACHGIDGSGSPFAPSLARSRYDHGD